LTEDQERVLQEVQADLKGPRAMLRLLQGDVGCGKTMVALLACLETAASGENVRRQQQLSRHTQTFPQ
jgi:ATP-dependent DNA helicase RecG